MPSTAKPVPLPLSPMQNTSKTFILRSGKGVYDRPAYDPNLAWLLAGVFVLRFHYNQKDRCGETEVSLAIRILEQDMYIFISFLMWCQRPVVSKFLLYQIRRTIMKHKYKSLTLGNDEPCSLTYIVYY
jgi:hypothetical protein